MREWNSGRMEKEWNLWKNVDDWNDERMYVNVYTKKRANGEKERRKKWG